MSRLPLPLRWAQSSLTEEQPSGHPLRHSPPLAMDILVRLPATPLRLVTFHLAQSLTARSSALRYASTTASTAPDPRKAYSHTLLLPKTSMPLKHKRPPEEERKFRARSTDDLYRKQVCVP